MTRHSLKLLGLALFAVASALLSVGDTAHAGWPGLRKGDVLVTRNAVFNFVPGYWNHVALYDGAGSVIEATPSLTGWVVRKTPLDTFYKAYTKIQVYRVNAH